MNTLEAAPTLSANKVMPTAAGIHRPAPDGIDKLLDTMGQLPLSPQILPPLLRALRESSTDINDVVELVSMDPALTAKLMTTSNTAFFSRTARVDSISVAMHQVGFETAYRLAATLVVGGAFVCKQRDQQHHAAELWRHAVMSAFAAQFIAEDIGADKGVLFTAGLLHDLGKVVLLQEHGEGYGRFLVESKEWSDAARAEREIERFGFGHAAIATRLLERWKFSPTFVATITHHGEPARAAEGDGQRAAACVNLGSALSRVGDAAAAGALAEIPAAQILQRDSRHLSLYQDLMAENMRFVEAMCRQY